MLALVALLPLLLFVVLLAGLRQTAGVAGLASAALCLALAIGVFGYQPGAVSLLGPLLEAVFISATILWILLPALGIYEFQARTGATETMAAWLRSLSARPQIGVLLIGWFFAIFLEGAAGFGTPIALVAPMLVALGFAPFKALVMALFGNAVGVSFGAVGTPVVPLLEAAAVSPTALSLLIVLVHAPLGWLLALLLFRLARPDEPGLAASWLWVLLAAALFFVPAALLAWFAGPELPTLGGAFIGLLLFAGLAWKARGDRATGPGSSPVELLGAAMPYLVVLALILATRLVGPVTDLLRGAALEWSIGAFGGTFAPLYHPGTMLMAALVLSALALGQGRSGLALSLRGAAARLPPVALALVAVLLLARLMVHSGMIETLARSAAGLMGPQWALAAPMVGAIGAFVTGSATSANILLADFQVAAATSAGVAPLVALAGQGFGAAIGNIIAPHNILAGAATVGLIGREGDVLKRTLPVCAAYALAGGAILLVIGWAL